MKFGHELLLPPVLIIEGNLDDAVVIGGFLDPGRNQRTDLVGPQLTDKETEFENDVLPSPQLRLRLLRARREQFLSYMSNIVCRLLYGIARGLPAFDLETNGLGANGYGAHSPGGYSLLSGFTAEVLLTLVFLIIIMGATHRKAPAGFAPLAIGLGLTLVHLISIPITNTSVNPARSTGPALVVGGWALQQLWLFWLAPLIGGALGGAAYRALFEGLPAAPAITGEPPPTT